MQRLKFERVRRGVSQQVLARIADMHQPEIAQIERGRLTPTTQQLARLGDALEVPPDELLVEVAVLGPVEVW